MGGIPFYRASCQPGVSKLVRIAAKAAVTTRTLITAAETTHLTVSFPQALAQGGCVFKHSDEARSARNVVVEHDFRNLAARLGALNRHAQVAWWNLEHFRRSLQQRVCDGVCKPHETIEGYRWARQFMKLKSQHVSEELVSKCHPVEGATALTPE